MILLHIAVAVGHLLLFIFMACVCLAAGERQLLRFVAAMLAAINLIGVVVEFARIFKAVHP